MALLLSRGASLLSRGAYRRPGAALVRLRRLGGAGLLALALGCDAAAPERGAEPEPAAIEAAARPRSASAAEDRAASAPEDRAEPAPRSPLFAAAPELARMLPEGLGRFRAEGPAEPSQTRVSGMPLETLERLYSDRGRSLRIRVLDAEGAAGLRAAFETLRSIHLDTLDEVSRPATVGPHRATLQWSRRTMESEAQLLYRDRFLISTAIWPADRSDEALDPLEALPELRSAR